MLASHAKLETLSYLSTYCISLEMYLQNETFIIKIINRK